MDKEAKKVIENYRKVSYRFFNAGFFIFPIVCAVAAAWGYSGSDNSSFFSRTPTAVKSPKNDLVGNAITKSNKNLGPVTVQFVRGFVSPSGEGEDVIVNQYRALTSLPDGTVLPQNTAVTSKIAKEFTESEGRMKVLTYLSILSNLHDANLQKKPEYSFVQYTVAQAIPPTVGAKSFFGLNCLDRPKFLPFMCDKAIDNFVANIPTTDINGDIFGVSTIINKLSPAKKEDVCKAYIEFTRKTGQKVNEVLVSACSDKIQEEYNLYYSFVKADKDINGGFDTTFADNQNDLNNYLLVSYMQSVITSNYNTTDVTNFLRLLKQMLQEEKVRGFYADLSNLFVQEFLIENIQKYKSDSGKEQWFSEAEDTIKFIRQGRGSGIGKGLLDLSSLEADTTNTVSIKKNIVITSEYVNDLVGKLSNFVLLSNPMINEDKTVVVSGKFTLPTKEQISVSITSRYENGNLFVTKVESADLDEAINEALTTNTVSLLDIGDVIPRYQKFEVTGTSYCGPLKKKVTGIKECESNYFSYKKGEFEVTIAFEGTKVSTVSINPSTPVPVKIEFYSKSSVIDLVDEINLNLMPKNTSSTPSISLPSGVSEETARQLLKTFNRYLDRPVKILGKIPGDNERYGVEFDAQGYSFKAEIDLSLNNKITELYLATQGKLIPITGVDFFLLDGADDTFIDLTSNTKTFLSRFNLE